MKPIRYLKPQYIPEQESLALPKELIAQDLQVVEAYLTALQFKDAYTYYHCLRVGAYAHLLAEALNLAPSEIQQAYYAGILHDIGKIGIPDAILNKPGRLTVEEYEIMKKHADHSAQMLVPYKDLPLIKKILPDVLHHHEQVNGKGYPHGLKDNQIPFIAKIVTVADTYDAITSERIYRSAKKPEFAYSEISLRKGIQFDADIAEAFLKQHPTWIIEENNQKIKLIA